jgi:site-specific recombinase XerD
LQASGLLLLQDLQERINRGGRWWRDLSATGPVKAQRLAAFLAMLLPAAQSMARPDFGAHLDHLGAPAGSALTSHTSSAGVALPSVRGDADAVQAWIEARAGSVATAKSYQREARRLLIWLQRERGKSLADMAAADCRAYMVFMERVPPGWISRDKAAVLAPGWAPFRAPLSVASRRQAVTVLSSMFDWLVSVEALPRNPWQLINRKIGDDAERNELDSRAFTSEAWAEVLRVLRAQPPSPAVQRALFVLRFVEATGLRSAELLDARLGDLRRHKGRWTMQVQGKGSRNRVVAIPGQAMQALDDYLRARELQFDQAAPEVPLLASTSNALAPIGYQALYKTLKAWLSKAVRHSRLQGPERDDALRASPHWLRHTFGTRALEREAPLDVVQGQMGHADPRTTMRYAKAQLARRLESLDRAFAAT